MICYDLRDSLLLKMCDGDISRAMIYFLGVLGHDFFSLAFVSYMVHLFQRGHAMMSCVFVLLCIVSRFQFPKFFPYSGRWDGGEDREKKGMGSVMPFPYHREGKGFASHYRGAFFSFFSVLLGTWYFVLGFSF